MEAKEASLLEFLGRSPQFVIPIYQRTYSWREKECRQLWDDILSAGRDNTISVHFIGSIVYIQEGLSLVTLRAPKLVIDGQQRLATVSLLLAALARKLGSEEPVDGFTADKIRTYYLLNELEVGERHYKLLLTQTDKSSLNAITSEDINPTEWSIRIKENFENFKKWLDMSNVEPTDVCKGLEKLVVVDIALSRDKDNPQLIFESMNATGRRLSQADLIRNFVLMGLKPELQNRLYERYWRAMEIGFGQEAYSTHFDSFMRHYLTVKTGDIPRIHEVYEAFKEYSRKLCSGEPNAEVLVKDLQKYAGYYCAMALGTETDPDLNQVFLDLRELTVDTAYPFLLELYDDYKGNTLSKLNFLDALHLIEAYVFRRAICSVPTNSLNKTFSTFARSLKKDRYLESIQAQFLSIRSNRRFPRDEEFLREFQIRDLYNFRSRSYWLRRFENFDRKERVTVNDYTIEHIMPQNEKLSKEWMDELGTEWERIHETYLHTLGNLTLTGYNSQYSDRPFKDKRDMEDGFGHSPLRVNRGLGEVETWNKVAIKARAERLAQEALAVWPAPKLSEKIIEGYKVKQVAATNYSIEDHPFLSREIVHELFEMFRQEVKALDPSVSEEFLKRYVAYKAETNFVDLVPKSQSLGLFLNVSFADIIDPRKFCTDVTGLGHLGSGDVSVQLTTLEELPYILGLVRQALERQLGNVEVT